MSRKVLVSSDKSLQTIFNSSGNDSHECFDLFCSYSKVPSSVLKGICSGCRTPQELTLNLMNLLQLD